MSEVQRFWSHEASNIRCVREADFDNATRLFLDAAERCIASERREKELQALMTAADERADHNARVSAIAVEDVLLLQKRADVLEGLLRRWLSRHAMGAGTDSMVIAETIAAVGLPALKPAAASPDFRMIGTEKMPPMEYDEP